MPANRWQDQMKLAAARSKERRRGRSFFLIGKLQGLPKEWRSSPRPVRCLLQFLEEQSLHRPRFGFVIHDEQFRDLAILRIEVDLAAVLDGEELVSGEELADEVSIAVADGPADTAQV